MKKFVGIAIVIAFAAFGGAVWYVGGASQSTTPFSPNPAFSEPLRILQVGNVALHVAVADSPPERTQGLSGTKYLPENTGMLFVFEDEGERGFWMKDMLFPIDIIWISSVGRVVDVTLNATPESYPKIFFPTKPAQFVLEVPTGFALRYGIEKGDAIKLPTP